MEQKNCTSAVGIKVSYDAAGRVFRARDNGTPSRRHQQRQDSAQRLKRGIEGHFPLLYRLPELNSSSKQNCLKENSNKAFVSFFMNDVEPRVEQLPIV